MALSAAAKLSLKGLTSGLLVQSTKRTSAQEAHGHESDGSLAAMDQLLLSADSFEPLGHEDVRIHHQDPAPVHERLNTPTVKVFVK